jgi:hypothetical protein
MIAPDTSPHLLRPLLQLWWVHQGAEGRNQELWQSLRVWLWLAPNAVRAIWKVTVAESPVLSFIARCGRRKEVRRAAGWATNCALHACCLDDARHAGI